MASHFSPQDPIQLRFDPKKVQNDIMGHVNSNAQITAWCSAIINTTVAQSPGDWYKPFMVDLGTAQGHTADYLNTIGPDAWSTLPNAIVNYSSTHNNAMGDVQAILTQVGDGVLSTDQISKIVQIFEALEQYLNQLLGSNTDSNVGPPALNPPTLYGCKNDLNAFRNNITNDNRNLISGQYGAAQEVNLLTVDENNMNVNITTLNSEISKWNNDILAADIGLGVSIFVAVVGIALAPVTGGYSLVLTGVGVAGIGGSIAADAVYNEKVNAAQSQIATDQAELTTDQQQVNALNGIINTLTSLDKLNVTAQEALQGMVNSFTALIYDAQTTINALNKADSGQAKGILEKLDIQNAISDWTNLSNLAQGILASKITQQVLTPPQ